MRFGRRVVGLERLADGRHKVSYVCRVDGGAALFEDQGIYIRFSILETILFLPNTDLVVFQCGHSSVMLWQSARVCTSSHKCRRSLGWKPYPRMEGP
jgi:hypothetical protein